MHDEELLNVETFVIRLLMVLGFYIVVQIYLYSLLKYIHNNMNYLIAS